jgi:hypothetical protein
MAECYRGRHFLFAGSCGQPNPTAAVVEHRPTLIAGEDLPAIPRDVSTIREQMSQRILRLLRPFVQA